MFIHPSQVLPRRDGRREKGNEARGQVWVPGVWCTSCPTLLRRGDRRPWTCAQRFPGPLCVGRTRWTKLLLLAPGTHHNSHRCAHTRTHEHTATQHAPTPTLCTRLSQGEALLDGGSGDLRSQLGEVCREPSGGPPAGRTKCLHQRLDLRGEATGPEGREAPALHWLMGSQAPDVR